MKAWPERGAILLDVLVATYILCIGLVPLAGLFIQLSGAQTQAGHQELAALLAQEKLEQLHAANDSLAGMNGTEVIEREGLRFQRSARTQTRTDLDATGHLTEAEVRVEWLEHGQRRSLALVTYFTVGLAVGKL